MKKWLFIILICFVTLGCTTEEVIEKEKLYFRITWKAYSGRGETVNRIVQDFNADQTNYEIELVGGDEDLQDIRSQIDEKGVDILVLPYRYVQLLGHETKLAEVKIETESKHIAKELKELGTIDEKLYGLPWVSHSMALLYNKDLLTLAGVNPDHIVDRKTFLSALRQVEEATGSKGIGLVGANHNDLSWMVNQFVYGSGSGLIDNGNIVINNDKSKEAINYYINELSLYAQPSWKEDTGVEVMEYFRNGEVAFEIQGLWGVTDIWKNGNPFEVGILPLSKIGANAEVGPMLLVYPAGLPTEKVQVIEAFLDYMTSLKAQEMIMQGEYSPEHDSYYPFRLPVRDDVISSDAFEPYKAFEIYINAYHYPSIDVPDPKWQVIKEDIYTPYLKNVVDGDMTIEMFLEKVEHEGERLLEVPNE